MSIEMDKAYEPKKYEAVIYKRWEDSDAFKPNEIAETGQDKPFSIVMPPPNANGVLHLGHMMFVIEDIMVRYNRMLGRPTLWLPGTDHAGIETQFVFERDVLAPQGKDRFDLGRDEFYKQIFDYSEKSKQTFLEQFKSLGFSADWSRLKFTLDPDIIKTVYATFKQMHRDGLVYRGNRIVNWCPTCQAAFADIEIDHEDREDAMYTLAYGSLQVATTRPETIFADAAVAVNPKDKRYAGLVGQTATIPLIDRPIGIIADDYVDPETGTGALKVTPAHDKNDYEIGQRHDLPEIQVVDFDGKLINVPEEFAGLSVTEGRKAVVAALDKAGKLVSTTPLTHSVAVHDRCGTVIEPLVTEQWYVRVQPLIEPTVQALEEGKIKIVPERFKKIALNWMAQEHDWNISRQIWWGIRIPVYYKTSNDPKKDNYIIAETEDEAIAYYGAGNYKAETDTFDTWFSSAQWPFATMQATGDFDRFYPTSVMETGRDILTKWVTKMIWMSIYRVDQVPFQTVYLHGMVNDAEGRKMSKSKGNGIDPLEMTAKYGTDALRMALVIGITPGNDGSLSETKIEGYRNFANKLWNVARFILSQLPDEYSPAAPVARNMADDWIMSRLGHATNVVTRSIESYDFSEAGLAVYSLLWDDFADWYVEASKVEPNLDLLVYGLEVILKLAHPFAPFVTEAIWQKMAWQSQDLISSLWPKPLKATWKGSEFVTVQTVVSEIRSIKADLGDQAKRNYSGTPNPFIEKLARVEHATDMANGLRIGDYQIEVNPAERSALHAKRQKRVDELTKGVQALQGKLANEAFKAKAPELWHSEQERLTQLQQDLDQERLNLSKLD